MQKSSGGSMKKFILTLMFAVALEQQLLSANKETQEVESFIQGMQQARKERILADVRREIDQKSEICQDEALLELFHEAMEQMGIQESIELRVLLPGYFVDASGVYCGEKSCGKNVLMLSPSLLKEDLYWAKFTIRHELEHHRQSYLHYLNSFHGVDGFEREGFADLEALKVCSDIDSPCWQVLMNMRIHPSKLPFSEDGYITARGIHRIFHMIKEKQQL
jgi:hypothetical protein